MINDEIQAVIFEIAGIKQEAKNKEQVLRRQLFEYSKAFNTYEELYTFVKKISKPEDFNIDMGTAREMFLDRK